MVQLPHILSSLSSSVNAPENVYFPTVHVFSKCSEMCKKKYCDNQPSDDLEPSINTIIQILLILIIISIKDH